MSVRRSRSRPRERMRCALLARLGFAAGPARAAGGYAGPVVGGEMAAPANRETSGLAAEPEPEPAFELPQAEAAGFSTDGRQIHVVSEKTQRLLRRERRP